MNVNNRRRGASTRRIISPPTQGREMPEISMTAMVHQTGTRAQQDSGKGASDEPTGDPCVVVIFGASGDLTKRLLMPALYNLACEGLLPEQFALVGADIIEMTTDQFRARMSDEKDGIKKFHTRRKFDQTVWDHLVSRFHYVQARDDAGYAK